MWGSAQIMGLKIALLGANASSWGIGADMLSNELEVRQARESL